MDVKKIGQIPDGGGWKAHGRAATRAAKAKSGQNGLRLRALPGR